jgi:hypothetical protein
VLDAVKIVCYAAPMTASPLSPDFEALLDGYKADYMAARNLSDKTRVEYETDIRRKLQKQRYTIAWYSFWEDRSNTLTLIEQ